MRLSDTIIHFRRAGSGRIETLIRKGFTELRVLSRNGMEWQGKHTGEDILKLRTLLLQLRRTGSYVGQRLNTSQLKKFSSAHPPPRLIPATT